MLYYLYRPFYIIYLYTEKLGTRNYTPMPSPLVSTPNRSLISTPNRNDHNVQQSNSSECQNNSRSYNHQSPINLQPEGIKSLNIIKSILY